MTPYERPGKAKSRSKSRSKISPKERQALEHELQADAGERASTLEEWASEAQGKAPPKRKRVTYPKPSWQGGHTLIWCYEETLTPAQIAYMEAYWKEREFNCEECNKKNRILSLDQWSMSVEQVLHCVNSPHHQEYHLRDKLTEKVINDFWDLCEELTGKTLVWSEVWKEFNARRPSLRWDRSKLHYLEHLKVKEGSWEHTLIEMDAVADFQPEDFEEGTRTPEEVARYRREHGHYRRQGYQKKR